MTQYSEEKKHEVTITDDGSKNVRTIIITYKDGVEIGRSNHRTVIAADEDIPQHIVDFIEVKKVKQPKRKNK